MAMAMAKKPKRHIIASRVGELERDAEARHVVAHGGAYDQDLFDWLSVPEREQLEPMMEAAIEAEVAGGQDLESEALIIAAFTRADRRRAARWPRHWWEHPGVQTIHQWDDPVPPALGEEPWVRQACGGSNGMPAAGQPPVSQASSG
jgi:hypothetical protein